MLSELRKILPIPESPIDTDETILTKNMEVLNVAFPLDYLEYGRIYGSGTISVCAYDWEIYSPFRASYPKFVARFFERQDAYRKAMETFDVPLELYPEPGGLLPFGHRDDVYFTWKTDGKANDWKVIVIWLYQNDAYKSFDMGFCQFLTSLLKRKIQVPGFTSKWNPRKDITFEPEVYSG